MPAIEELTDHEIARWRLRNQGLGGECWSDPGAVVRNMLAVQAENVSQSGWALAVRCDPRPTEVDVQRLLDIGRILRTHVIRPTWHYVLPDDIVWLTELTAPRIRKSFISAQQQIARISDQQRDRTVEFVVEAIAADGALTRAEIQHRLSDAGLPASGAAVSLAMGIAECSALVCSGPTRDGNQTYALLSDRAPDARRLDRPEALTELTNRYISSHGPATERDLSYWASLTLTDVRQGIDANRELLASFDHNGLTYWHLRDDEPPAAPPPRPDEGPSSAHILQILDEMYRGYHVESRWVLDEAGVVEDRGREPAIGMALIDAQLVATMKRRLTSAEVEFTLDPYRPLTGPEVEALEAVAEVYGRYCNRNAIITFV